MFNWIAIFGTIKLCVKEWAKAHLKTLSTKCVYKSYIFNIYVLREFGLK